MTNGEDDPNQEYIRKHPKMNHSFIYNPQNQMSNRMSTTSDYFPSGSAWPWTDEKWNSNDLINFFKDEHYREETKIQLDDKELETIRNFTHKEQCHSYRLSKNGILAMYDTLLVVFDNILKIVPTVLLSSLPLLILKNTISGTTGFDNNLIVTIYGIILIAILLSSIPRWFFKKRLMTIEQYVIIAIKKEEELT